MHEGDVDGATISGGPQPAPGAWPPALAGAAVRATDEALDHAARVRRTLEGWGLPAADVLAATACALAQDEDELAGLARALWALREEVEARLRARPAPARVQRALILRRLFAEAYRAPARALCLLADRLAALEGEAQRGGRARALAEQGEDIYQPLLEMMGLWDELRRAHDLCLRILRPAKYEQIMAQIASHQRAAQEDSDCIRARLEGPLSEVVARHELRWHPSRAFSIVRRQAQGDPLFDRRVRVDVLVDGEAECYRALSAIYALWPAPSSHLTNRLCQPRFNAYRTLNLKHHCPDCSREEVEFNILTWRHDAINREGIVAARYRPETREKVPGAWWEDEATRVLVCGLEDEDAAPRDAGEAPRDAGEAPRDAGEAPRDAGEAAQVWVFSPIGQVFRFEAGSTPIDYAFRIHSDRALHTRGIWVNGEEKDHDYQLRDGDLVSLEFDTDYPGPNPQWLDTVKSTVARNTIRHALRRSQGTRNRGKALLEEELEREQKLYKMRVSPEALERWIDEIYQKLGYPSADALYLYIAQPGHAQGKHASAERIVRRLIDKELAQGVRAAGGGPLPLPLHKVSFARCGLERPTCARLPHDEKLRKEASISCRILPGDLIVGYMKEEDTPYQRLMVYRRDCPQVPRNARAIPLEWRPEATYEMMSVEVTALDRPRLLEEVLAPVYALYEQKLYLYTVEAGTNPQNGQASVTMTISAPSAPLLDRLHAAYLGLMNAGRIGGFAIHSLSPEGKLRLARGQAGRRYQNPYREGVARETVFVGRFEELDRIVHALEGGARLMAIIGQKRMGKTSLLTRLQESILPQRGFMPLFVDLRRATKFGVADVIATMAHEIHAQLTRPPDGGRAARRRLPRLDHQALVANPFGALERYLERVQAAFPSEPLVVLLDEFTILDLARRRGELERGFFGGFRSLVERAGGARFILAIQEVAYKRAARDQEGWADLQSATVVSLGPLDADAAARLIREPKGDVLRYDDEVVREILALTDRHPYYLQIILNRIVSRKVGQTDVTVRPADLQGVLPGILEAGDLYFQHLIELLDHPSKRALLEALARAGGEGRAWLGRAELGPLARGAGLEGSLEGLLEDLHRDGVLLASGARDEPRYRLGVPLFARWLLDES